MSLFIFVDMQKMYPFHISYLWVCFKNVTISCHQFICQHILIKNLPILYFIFLDAFKNIPISSHNLTYPHIYLKILPI